MSNEPKEEMLEVARNNYFVAHDVQSPSPAKKIISITDVEQRDKPLSKAIEIIQAMADIQSKVVSLYPDQKKVLLIDFFYLTSVIGAASRSPEFQALTDLSKEFENIIVYSSKYDLVVSVTTQLLQVITRLARGQVRVASSFSSAFQIAQS